MGETSVRIVADAWCLHCGHVSGTLEGVWTPRKVVFNTFVPRPGFIGTPKPGERLLCERCRGPIVPDNTSRAEEAQVPKSDLS